MPIIGSSTTATAVVELLMMGVRCPKHVELYLNDK